MTIKSPKDFWAGGMFIAVGGFFVVVAQNYHMGSLQRMGPGYFPSVLGGLLAFLGAIVFARSFRISGPRTPGFHFRPLLLVLVAIVTFAYLLQPLGLVVATTVLIVTSALGGHDFRWKEVALLSAALIAFAVVVFMKALALPFPPWPAFLQ